MSTIAPQVLTVIADCLGCRVDEVALAAELASDLGADEWALMEVAGVLERTFRIAISVDEIVSFTTVASVVAAVEETLVRQAGAAGGETDG